MIPMMTKDTTGRALGALLLVVVVGACSSGNKAATDTTPTTAGASPTTSSGGPAASGPTVKATDARQFSPDTLTVAVGQTVTWTNDGNLPHTVTFDDGPAFDQGLDPGGEVSRTFDAKGTFRYHCAIHGQSMHGEIVVG